MNDESIRNSEKARIILSLIGDICGIGDTSYDNKIFDNLCFLDDRILFPIINDLCNNARYNGYEESLVEIKEKSIKILKNCKCYMYKTLKEIE